MSLPRTVLSLTALLLTSSLSIGFGQQLKPGPQDLSFFSSVDETDQPYAVYLPASFDSSKRYPLVVFLHGAMSNHRLGLRRAFGQGNIQGADFATPGFVPVETDLEATRYFPHLKQVDFIVAAPFARGTAGYQGIPERDVYEMIDDLKRRFPIDEDRLYLTGLSMGGGGTLWLGLTRPDLWAAIAPCCPAPPAGTTDLAGNARNLPVHLFVGDKDFLFQVAQDWRHLFQDNQITYEYAEYPGISHNSWEYAYRDGFIFKWFAQFKRDRFPGRVTFSTRWYRYSNAYWVRIDKLTPGTLASIDAVFTATNALTVTTDNLGAFTLRLDGHALFDADEAVVVTLDGERFEVRTPDAVSFSRSDTTWQNTRYTPGRFAKRANAEGPLNAAVADNHIYVFGTAGNPSEKETEARRAQAAHAANWSLDRGMFGRIMVFPRVVADRQVRQSDLETSNMILFGTRDTNNVIEQYADHLPMHLDSDAKSYGLVYIYPLGDRYVLVNSGLAWWTPSKEPDPRGMRFLASVSNKLDDFEDFILFKKTPDNVISHGYFDESWEIPEAEAAKMLDAGVVSLADRR